MCKCAKYSKKSIELTCFPRNIGYIILRQRFGKRPVQNTIRIDHPEQDTVAEERCDHHQPGPAAAVGRRQIIIGTRQLFLGLRQRAVVIAYVNHLRPLTDQVGFPVFDHCSARIKWH